MEITYPCDGWGKANRFGLPLGLTLFFPIGISHTLLIVLPLGLARFFGIILDLEWYYTVDKWGRSNSIFIFGCVHSFN